jgi:hypothetical protein
VKKGKTKAKIAQLQQKIAQQTKRAARPSLPVNTHVPVSKSLAEKRAAIDRKEASRREWEAEE